MDWFPIIPFIIIVHFGVANEMKGQMEEKMKVFVVEKFNGSSDLTT